VAAKDLGTCKEQKIRLDSSSGLNDEEIKRMVKDAEVHAQEDKKLRESAEAKNEADNLIYSTEKSLKDYGGKVSEADRKAIEEAVAELRKAMESDDTARIKSKTEALKQAAYKLAEEVYKASSAQGAQGQGAQGQSAQGAQGAGGEPSGPSGGREAGSSETVEDADYEVVDDDSKKS